LNTDASLREIIKTLMQNPSPTRYDLDVLKTKIAGKYQLQKVPSNSEIIRLLQEDERRVLLPLLMRKTTRTISGVTVVAVMTKPHRCPQPEPCAYCPGGPTMGVPQSYTGFEPAAMRGIQNNFDPSLQVKSRIQQLEAIGHCVDKVELIIMGGTFPATPINYQSWFVQRCLDAISERESNSLEEAKKNAERSNIRNVGVTVETRPDWAKEAHVDQMLSMGVTRVELGVQNPNDGIYTLVGRTHTVQDVVESTRMMKDAGLKIVYHLMPGLPGSNPEEDRKAFSSIFTDPCFKPDMIKIYPCLVIENTKAHKWYSEGKFRPYTNEEAAEVIAEIKMNIPRWVRIMRVQRDIPAPLIVAGVNKSNLRQLVQLKLLERGMRCNCIRCREVGHKIENKKMELDPEDIQILTTNYDASDGEEVFISAEEPESDVLVGYLRLRIPSDKAHRQEIRSEPCAIVRELHVCGSLVPVGKHRSEAWQHKGFGNVLLAKAEEMVKDRYDLRKMLVISALGTKQYYKRLGYTYDGAYMSKVLEEERE
jgi:elongator complex protein 3